ncbi:hypothetical protein [Kordiimonas aquimaris]|uniref:hypothetical protein n=1 Tax=Kordiimonas aquimaris TaxID=707591 RepID=UPI0021D0FC3D|nr:hypothetical protein [Kordiimonas aquimaris]
MTSLLSRLIRAFSLTLIAWSTWAQDTPEDLYGRPDLSRPEYGQFDFLRGEWLSSITIIDANGTRKPLEGTSDITAFYLADGRTIQTCFRAAGFYSTDVRAYDETKGVWRAHFLNATAQRWSGFEVQYIDSAMHTIVLGGFSGTEDFDVKTVQHNITQDSFQTDVFRRVKGSNDWVQTYEMNYKRKLYKASGPRC